MLGIAVNGVDAPGITAGHLPQRHKKCALVHIGRECLTWLSCVEGHEFDKEPHGRGIGRRGPGELYAGRTTPRHVAAIGWNNKFGRDECLLLPETLQCARRSPPQRRQLVRSSGQVWRRGGILDLSLMAWFKSG